MQQGQAVLLSPMTQSSKPEVDALQVFLYPCYYRWRFAVRGEPCDYTAWWSAVADVLPLTAGRFLQASSQPCMWGLGQPIRQTNREARL